MPLEQSPLEWPEGAGAREDAGEVAGDGADAAASDGAGEGEGASAAEPPSDPGGEPMWEPMSPQAKINAFRNHNGSLARSVQQYSMRRLIMQEFVESGTVYSTLTAEEEAVVHM